MDNLPRSDSYLALSKAAIEQIKIEAMNAYGNSYLYQISRMLDDKSGVRISPDTIRRILSGKRAKSKNVIMLLDCFGLSTEDENFIEKDNIIQDVILDPTFSAGTHVNITSAVNDLYEAKTEDVQAIASAQIKILDSYHREVLTQAKNSFRWALITSSVGFFFFLTSVIFVVSKQSRDRALIPLLSGAVIEVIAGVNFYLYGQATLQLSSFHRKLDQTQRFLLANSICESLDGEAKQISRSELVKTVSTLTE